MKFLAAVLALAVSAAAAPSDLQERTNYPSYPSYSQYGNVVFCSDSQWKSCGGGPTSVSLDGSCQKLSSTYYTSLGAFGPDPYIFCNIYADDYCSPQYWIWGAGNPGTDSLYTISKTGVAPAGTATGIGKNEKGHSAKSYQCFYCPSCTKSYSQPY